MTFCKIGPTLAWLLKSKIGVQISIRLLRFCYDIDHFVSKLFQHRITLTLQQISYRFKPFRYITILKHHSVKLTLLLTGSNFKVRDRMAWLSLRDSIIKRLPLIRNYNFTNQSNIFRPERVLNFAFELFHTYDLLIVSVFLFSLFKP
ncbi:hypothetical protein D3C73_995760 [compost metagenome]